jgi:hypothetical protein
VIRRAALGGLAALALASAARAAPPKGEPPAPANAELAATFFPYLDVYLQLAPRDRSLFAPEYFVRAGGRNTPPPHVTLVREGRRTPVPLDGEGRVLSVPGLADLKGGAVVEITPRPRDSVSAHLEMRALAPTAQTMDAGQIAEAIAQVDHAVHRSAGLMSFAVPHFARAVFVGAGAGRAVFADGRQAPLPPGRNGPSYDPSQMKNVRALVFERTPARVYIVAGL